MVSAAEATTTLRVGINVLNNDLRHPVLVAREAAAVDLLTDGRLLLGLGAGSIKAEYDEAGLRFDAGKIRVERLAEAVAIIKRLMSGEEVTFAGRHYQITGHSIARLPAQKPHPPLMIGGNGRQLLTLAAREADVVAFSGLTFVQGGAVPPDLSGWRMAAVDELVRLVGDHFPAIELNALVQRVVVTEDRHRAAEELTTHWTQLTADEMLASPYVLIGTVEEIAEDLQARRDRWGISYCVVHEPYLDTFAPIVARLAASDQGRCRSRAHAGLVRAKRIKWAAAAGKRRRCWRCAIGCAPDRGRRCQVAWAA